MTSGPMSSLQIANGLEERLRIAIIEDNLAVAKGIAFVLRDAGHAVDLLHNGAEADLFLRDNGAEVIVLDINLPGMSGLDVLRALRSRGDTRPVLLLTARSETGQRIEGLDSGADDYLVKPFEMEELSARIRALARRKGEITSQDRAIGALNFDSVSRQLRGPDGILDLPRRELAVFEALLKAQGRTVSKQTLLDSVYGTGTDIDEQVVEVYTSRLRKRLKPFGIEIRVRRGLGYAMQAGT